MKPALDDIDRQVLHALQEVGRISNAELAKRIGLSRAATHARVRKLEQLGVISRYTAIVDPEGPWASSSSASSASRWRCTRRRTSRGARAAIAEMPEVLESWHVTGDFDYVLKVAVRGRSDLQRFILDRLTPPTKISDTSMFRNPL